MASIIFRDGKSKPWLAQVHRKGHRIFSRSFAQKKDAQRWAAEQERTIDLTGLPLTIEELKNTTVGDLVDRYLEKVTPRKASRENEKLVLEKFKKHPMCKKSLAYLSSAEGATYRDQRLKDKWKPKGTKGPAKLIKPSTIRREVNTLRHIFEVARTEWKFTNLINPFNGLIIPNNMIVDGEVVKISRRRKRRLEPGEQILLEKASEKCIGPNKLYVPLAISLAIETGMRLQEILNLTWGDIDIETRRIEIRKSKTDERTIVMTARAMFLFMAIMPKTINPKRENKDQNVFPMPKVSFKQVWKGLVKRAGIKPNANGEKLTFHDLRREAGSRFGEAGLTKGEHDLMMGHANSDMTSLYIHADLDRIQQKLDDHQRAKTFAIQERQLAAYKAGKKLSANNGEKRDKEPKAA